MSTNQRQVLAELIKRRLNEASSSTTSSPISNATTATAATTSSTAELDVQVGARRRNEGFIGAHFADLLQIIKSYDRPAVRKEYRASKRKMETAVRVYSICQESRYGVLSRVVIHP